MDDPTTVVNTLIDLKFLMPYLTAVGHFIIQVLPIAAFLLVSYLVSGGWEELIAKPFIQTNAKLKDGLAKFHPWLIFVLCAVIAWGFNLSPLDILQTFYPDAALSLSLSLPLERLITDGLGGGATLAILAFKWHSWAKSHPVF